MKRLFTFGCSWTYYIWPTWADLLGLTYNDYQNWGCAGAGNQMIFERMIEANTRHKFTKDDTIVIMWSSHQRHDHYKDGWIPDRGNVLNSYRQDYNNNYIKQYFDPKGSVIHSLNYISAAQAILDNTNANWYMTSMDDLMIPLMEWKGVENHYPSFINKPIFELWPELKIYENIFKRNNWLPCCTDEFKDGDIIKTCFQTRNKATSIDAWKDHHPTPESYYKWLKHIAMDHPVLAPNETAVLKLINRWRRRCGQDVVYSDEAYAWLEQYCRPKINCL